MTAVSIHLSEDAYREMKSLAAERGRPVAELILQAMEEYLDNHRRRRRSVLDRKPHDSGPLLEPWTREQLLDEMLDS